MILAQICTRQVGTATFLVATAAACALIQRKTHWKIFLRSLLTKAGIWNFKGAAAGTWPLDRWIDSRAAEAALEPEMEIIDPHHHLWDPTTQPKMKGASVAEKAAFYKVATPEEVTETTKQDFVSQGLKKILDAFGWRQLIFVQPYMAKEFLADIGNRGSGKPGHKVVKTVYVECGWHPPDVEEALKPIGEVIVMEQVHTENPTLCNGIVGEADLRLEDVEKTLQAYAKMPIVRGVRHALAWSSDPNILSHAAMCDETTAMSPAFRKGFALLSKYNLTFDTWLFHENLPGLIDLARSFPEQVIVADHVAQPLGIGKFTARGVFPVWEQSIRELAKASKNVHVKLSGMGMCYCGLGHDAGPTPPSSDKLAEDWGPYFRVVLDAFGVERCMFASNFPVDRVSTDYTIMWNAFKKIVKDYSKDQKRMLFYENAKRIYRL